MAKIYFKIKYKKKKWCIKKWIFFFFLGFLMIFRVSMMICLWLWRGRLLWCLFRISIHRICGLLSCKRNWGICLLMIWILWLCSMKNNRIKISIYLIWWFMPLLRLKKRGNLWKKSSILSLKPLLFALKIRKGLYIIWWKLCLSFRKERKLILIWFLWQKWWNCSEFIRF